MIKDARRRVGHKVALQGNMIRPCMHRQPASEEEVATILAGSRSGAKGVLNLGYGIIRTSRQKMRVFVEAVHRFVRTAPPLRSHYGSRVITRQQLELVSFTIRDRLEERSCRI